MSVSLSSNNRVEIYIKPWAITASDGTRLSEEVVGLWFTEFTPLYSSPLAMEAQGGAIVSGLHPCLMKLAIFEISKWVDATVAQNCPNPDTDFFKQARWRYVTLKALLMLIDGSQGLYPTVRKLLGDFEVEYDASASDNSFLTRLQREIAKLEPVVLSGGCIPLGGSLPPLGMTKGKFDPYRRVPARQWEQPMEGEYGRIEGVHTHGYNDGTWHHNRYRKANGRLSGKRRRGKW